MTQTKHMCDTSASLLMHNSAPVITNAFLSSNEKGSVSKHLFPLLHAMKIPASSTGDKVTGPATATELCHLCS